MLPTNEHLLKQSMEKAAQLCAFLQALSPLPDTILYRESNYFEKGVKKLTEIIHFWLDARSNYLQETEKRNTMGKRTQKAINEILYYSRNAYGRYSTQVAEIINLSERVKIRHTRVKHPTQIQESEVIGAEKKFDSLIICFSDIIARVQSYGKQYEPANRNISMDELHRILDELIESNTKVIDYYGYMEQLKKIAVPLFFVVKHHIGKIRLTVKDQFGPSSPEYIRIKSINL